MKRPETNKEVTATYRGHRCVVRVVIKDGILVSEWVAEDGKVLKSENIF